MTNYADLDELRSRVYFESATLDERFTWEETDPLEADGRTYRQYRLTGCAHRPQDRDGVLCTVCGETVAPAKTITPPKKRGKR